MAEPGRLSASVIVPAFDRPADLRRCLAALAAQSAGADLLEILVVDNGSSADLRAVVEAVPRARLLREERPGSYAARNLGIAQARGEALAFTDADCSPAPDWLERGLAALARAPDCGFVAGRVDLVLRDPDRPTAAELYDQVVMNFHQDRNVSERHFGATANLFVFRRVFDTTGPFDAALRSGGDLEWGRRVHALGLEQLYADDARVAHPARQALSGTFAQARRIAGGRFELERRSRAGALRRALSLARAFVPALPFYARLLGDSRLPRLRDRFRVVLVAFRVKYVIAAELLRLALGGEPSRG